MSRGEWLHEQQRISRGNQVSLNRQSFRKRIILAGGGHAHLHCLLQAAEYAKRGHDLVLVTPGPLWYSGLVSGVLSGLYPPELACIDIESVAAKGGAAVVEDRVTKLDYAAAQIELASGTRLAFDALSLCLGSKTLPIEGEAARPDRCFAVKPVDRLIALRTDLLKCMKSSNQLRVVIAGGGVSAVEVAANILGFAEKERMRVNVTLVARTFVLCQAPPAAACTVVDNLTKRGAEIIQDQLVVKVDDTTVLTRCGAAHPYDLFVNATGVQPSSFAAEAGLPVDELGAMRVDVHLRALTDTRIHGGGDMIAWADSSLPKVGVYAIREGPILHHNLLTAVEGGEPKRFKPQAHHLWIMNLGDGTGLAVRGQSWWHGKTALWFKNRIDRRFLRQFRS